MRKSIAWPLAAALATAVTACGGAVLSPTRVSGGYDSSTLNYIAGKGKMYTQIVGNPFEVPKDQLGSAVTRTMFGSHSGPTIRFSTERDPNYTSPYRVVVVFNPGKTVDPYKLCQDVPYPVGKSPGALQVAMAFCSASDYETFINGRLDGVKGPDDPAFRTLIRQMTSSLFPRISPDPNGGGDFNN